VNGNLIIAWQFKFNFEDNQKKLGLRTVAVTEPYWQV
jgi:hypothetical protein